MCGEKSEDVLKYLKNEIRTAINQYRAFIHSITESNGRKGRRASVHWRFVIITQRRKKKNHLATESKPRGSIIHPLLRQVLHPFCSQSRASPAEW
jgi:hypothetical protein